MPIQRPDAELEGLLSACASNSENEAGAATYKLAKALQVPLQEGVINGDIYSGIFSVEEYKPGTVIEYPIDFMAPGTEGNYVAYTVPAEGRIPEKQVSGDYIAVPTYTLGAAIDCPTRYLRDSNWNIVKRMMAVLEGMFTRKLNTDAWRVIVSAAAARNLEIYDSAATAGFMSKRLVSLMKLSVRRTAGGNNSSVNRRRLTDLYISPEANEDWRNMTLTELDDVTRREIYLSNDQTVARYDDVNFHILDELGEGQEFQLYYTNTLGKTIGNSKLEICVGLDLSQNNAFVMPMRQNIELYEDMQLFRQRRTGFWGHCEVGFGQLDSRAVLIGAL